MDAKKQRRSHARTRRRRRERTKHTAFVKARRLFDIPSSPSSSGGFPPFGAQSLSPPPLRERQPDNRKSAVGLREGERNGIVY